MEGEEYPSEKYKNSKWLDTLEDYIQNHDFVGYEGPKSAESIAELEPLKSDWVNMKIFKDLITREEAWEGCKWAGRHMTAYFKKKFPEKEVVWHRSPTARK